MKWTQEEMARLCDHTQLKATAQPEDIRQLCKEARKYRTASVCINSCYASLAAECLQGTDVKTCVVIGFPLGAMSTAAKAFEARNAIENGAEEIDMVINIGALLAGDMQYFYNDIKAVVDAAENHPVKAIIETCYLDEDQKVMACEVAEKAGAAFIKTSTGFGAGGATVSDVALMRKCVGTTLGVKAAGGIRTARDAAAMIEAGASRIGTGSLIDIMREFEEAARKKTR